jgi:hypothetical protein
MPTSVFLGGVGGGGTNFSGTGNPNGVVTGTGGQSYLDTATGIVYIKQALASGVSGWYPLVMEGVGEPATLSHFSWHASPPGTSIAGDNIALTGNGINLQLLGGTTPTAHRAADAYYMVWTTAAAAGNSAGGFDVNFATSRLQWSLYNFDLAWKIRTDQTAIADTRLFVGLWTADPTNSDTVTGRCLLFRYSSVIGAQWDFVSNDNTGQAVSSNIAAAAANTAYLLRIRYVSPNAFVSINNGAEVTISSKVPTDTTNPYVGCYAFNVAGAGGTRSVEVSRMGCTWGS